MESIDAVLAKQGEAAGVHVLDGGDIDAVRIFRAPRTLGCLAQPAHEGERRRAVRERHEGETERRAFRQHAERDLSDQAKRAFAADEEIDQVHIRPREVSGGQLRHVGHPIVRHRNPYAPMGELDVEIAVAMGARGAALDVEDVTARQDDRQRLGPVARRAVFERCRAGGVRRDRPADEGAEERRRGRVVTPGPIERRVELGECDTGFHANRLAADLEDAIEPLRAEEDLAHRCRAAGERRLRADRQHGVGALQQRCRLSFAGDRRDARGVATRKMRRILGERGEHIRIACNSRQSRFAARDAGADQTGRHRAILDGCVS